MDKAGDADKSDGSDKSDRSNERAACAQIPDEEGEDASDGYGLGNKHD